MNAPVALSPAAAVLRLEPCLEASAAAVGGAAAAAAWVEVLVAADCVDCDGCFEDAIRSSKLTAASDDGQHDMGHRECNQIKIVLQNRTGTRTS